MKLSKKFIAIPAIALAAGISLAACSSSNTYSGPALTAGTATARQMCQAEVSSTHLTNTLTGQDTGTWIVSSGTASTQSNLNGSGNEVALCDFTLDTGADFPATVTLFADGSIGLTGGH